MAEPHGPTQGLAMGESALYQVLPDVPTISNSTRGIAATKGTPVGCFGMSVQWQSAAALLPNPGYDTGWPTLQLTLPAARLKLPLMLCKL